MNLGPTSGLRLRTKLLLLALTTLTLPWAGCQYAKEMESVLRANEQQSLLAVASTIAASLQGRRELLYRTGAAKQSRTAGPLDIEPIVMTATPVLDGIADEWPSDSRNTKVLEKSDGDSLRLLTTTRDRWLYGLAIVRDNKLVFDRSDVTPLDSATLGDRLWLAFDDPRGGQQRVFLSASGPGALRGRRIETREYGREEVVDELRVEGAWRVLRDGYAIEFRIPLSMIGQHFGVLIDDRDRRGGVRSSLGTLDPAELTATGLLIAASPDLSDRLQQFAQPGVELQVASRTGATLARLEAPALPQDYTAMRGLLPRLYRRFLDGDRIPRRTSDAERERLSRELVATASAGKATTALTAGRYENRVIVTAAVPIFDNDRQQVIGVLQLAQTADRWLTLRDRALTRLLNLTLLATGLAVLATFWFAGRLALRIARLRAASESALTREGRLAVDLPETNAPDELGDLSRSFDALLRRLNGYTGYLRTLAGKLAHEIRTPLTIVRSSLDNLEHEPLSADATTYVARARHGAERLNGILLAMGAATRVEEAIANSERVEFDLGDVVRSAVDAYASAFSARRFTLEQPDGSCRLRGSPDLIVQMLDKLIDNAVDFSANGDTIIVRLLADPTGARLEVENPGPLLPDTRDSLFESLWQSRQGTDARPHFGLGLYIVRLIADFHGGYARAANLPDHSGVRLSVTLARTSD
ncbi:MAG TPA: ATP-binding protein [Steroidobacteraceae bacterium]|nr:ATP-binding protein [Steroidobacteraceae bacterium]HRX87817.1 ATP-binding protein [Steroidobacteraceae bacterium]